LDFLKSDSFICYILLHFVTMAKGKKESGVQRISPELSIKVKELLEKNNNKLYCKSITRFVDIAVIQLLEILEKKGDKIRWSSNE